MRIVIQGEEITVTLKADRPLTTQEIVSAHQLSTGNFEALFVAEDSESVNHPQSDPVEPHEHKPGWIEKGTHVEVEVLCPFCGHTGKIGTRWGNSYCKCPECNEKLFNRFATGIPGEKNNFGCHYVADEPMKFRDQIEDDIKLFTESNGKLR